MQMGVRAIPQESKLFDLLEHYGVRIEKTWFWMDSGQVSVPQVRSIPDECRGPSTLTLSG